MLTSILVDAYTAGTIALTGLAILGAVLIAKRIQSVVRNQPSNPK